MNGRVHDLQASVAGTVARSETLPLGVVVERREIAHRWARHRWTPVDLIVGAPPVDAWRPLAQGEGWARWHAATLPFTLHRKETEAYRYTLSGATPSVWVRMRPASQPNAGLYPVEVGASAYDAHGQLEFGEDMVEPVPMPPPLVAWVQAFIDRHHVDEPFFKRKRKHRDAAAHERSEFRRQGPGGAHD